MPCPKRSSGHALGLAEAFAAVDLRHGQLHANTGISVQ